MYATIRTSVHFTCKLLVRSVLLAFPIAILVLPSSVAVHELVGRALHHTKAAQNKFPSTMPFSVPSALYSDWSCAHAVQEYCIMLSLLIFSCVARTILSHPGLAVSFYGNACKVADLKKNRNTIHSLHSSSRGGLEAFLALQCLDTKSFLFPHLNKTFLDPCAPLMSTALSLLQIWSGL